MLTENHLNSDKTEILINSYAKLLNDGVSADEILVIVQNFKKKTEFIEGTKKLLKKDAITSFNIYTFFGLIYNKILENWMIVENEIKDTSNVKITPSLCGLEVSQYIFKKAIDEVEFKGYNSKMNLLHQLLRRYSLCVLNALTPDEIRARAKILSDPFYFDIKNALNLYKLKTIDLRAFDYLRQADIFKFVYKNTKNPYKYVILDDGDEITPALFEYLTHIKNDIKEFFIAYDPLGCTRKGFLGALEFDFEKFTGEKASRPAHDKKTEKALEIFTSVKSDKPFTLENTEIKSFVRHDEMVDDAVKKINELLSNPKNRLKPSDIAIVTPNIDDFLKIRLEKIKAPLQYLSGSEKLSKNPALASFLEILKLLNNKNLKISPYILRGILANIVKTDYKDALNIADIYERGDDPLNLTLEKFIENTDKVSDSPTKEKIEEFLSLLDDIKDLSLSSQLYSLSQKYIAAKIENRDTIYKINQLLKQIRDFEEIFSSPNKDVKALNRELLCQLENTIISENPLFGANINEDAVIVSTAQKLIDNSISQKHTFLLDTTSSNWTKQDIGPLYNAWVFQKSWKKTSFELQDNINCALDKTARILRKIFLLNSGKIYVYSSIYDFLGAENFKGINGYFKIKEIAPQDELDEINAADTATRDDKTPGVLNAAENPDDSKGPAADKTNGGGKKLKIIPRKDQAPVLEYKKGAMAVSAVAGAGKTTIMLALIMKLLDENVHPENIFVLTFMESAARNFKERIKENFPNLVELPHISTIHGLALRILRENNNHAKLNLDVDFEILDEIKRGIIIKEILNSTGVDLSKAELYERAISAYKNQKYPSEDKLSPLFKRIFNTYKTTLLSGNYIDYDDLLSLSLTLLRGDKGVREYYQNLMHYVIEDEAQDSSEIQQELIKILSSKHGNIIRCGDVNQAITTTFSNADVKGFKDFIKNNHNVKMNYSNRNATGIIDFSNSLINFGLKTSPEAFLAVETKPVAGKNIVDKNAVYKIIFDKEAEEKEFILNKITEINAQYAKRISELKAPPLADKNPKNPAGAALEPHPCAAAQNQTYADPKTLAASNPKNTDNTAQPAAGEPPKAPSVAILLRSNREILEWSNYLSENSTVKFTANSDTLDLNPVFRTILAVLNFISDPLNNYCVKNFAKTMMDLGFYKSDTEIFDFLEKNKNTPFILGENEYFAIFWDLKYFLCNFSAPVFEIAHRAGEFYFANDKNTANCANIPLVSGIVTKVYNTQKTFEDTVKKLNDMAQKPNRTGIKLIPNTTDNTTRQEPSLKILTLHKSKGDEFDYVFIPALTKDNLPLNFSDIKLKENTKFIENVKTQSKNEDELKKEILDENFRLAYVGATRAKRKLWLTCAKEYKIFSKLRKKSPDALFDTETLDRTENSAPEPKMGGN